jgi:hypothetical protein
LGLERIITQEINLNESNPFILKVLNRIKVSINTWGDGKWKNRQMSFDSLFLNAFFFVRFFHFANFLDFQLFRVDLPFSFWTFHWVAFFQFLLIGFLELNPQKPWKHR